MSDSNIGARKKMNIRNHIFVVNSVMHDVLNKKSNEPIDIMVLDYKQMFDSECLYECMNDVFETGVTDDNFSLIYEANRETLWQLKHQMVCQGEKLSMKLLCTVMFWLH